MKYSKMFLLSFILILPFIIVSESFSEVKILLKNGRSIIADSCREANGKLICYKMGGTFEFDKGDILNLKEIAIEPRETVQPGSEESKNGAGKTSSSAAEPAKKTDGKDEGAKTGKGMLIRGTNPEAEKRLDQINQRKTELKAERERLSAAREQLYQDTKDTGLVKSKEQFDEIKKRIADLEEGIKKFNEEVNRLNEEEKKIIESLKK